MRVARGHSSPARSRNCSSGAAGWSKDGGGARGISVISSSWFCFLAALPPVAIGSMPSFLSRYLVRPPPSGGLDLEKLLSGVLPWWWARWGRVSKGACFPNKLEGQLLVLGVDGGGSSALGDADRMPSAASHGGHGGYRCWLHLISVVVGGQGNQAVTAAYLGSFLSAVLPTALCSSTAESAGRAAATPSLLDACCASVCGVQPPGLDAIMEAFCSGAVCSRCSTPSGRVPGGAAVDRAWMQAQIGGAGARRRPGLDCFSYLCSRVLVVIVKDPDVIFIFFLVLLVMCTPPTAG